MTVYALTGTPFGSRKQYVLGVYEQKQDALMSAEKYDEYMYSELEIEEVEFYENYIDNSLDYD